MKEERVGGLVRLETEKDVCLLSRKPGTYNQMKFKALSNGQGYFETNQYKEYVKLQELVDRSPQNFFNFIKEDIEEVEEIKTQFSNLNWKTLRALARLGDMPDYWKKKRVEIEKWLTKNLDKYREALELMKEEYGDDYIR